VLNQVIRERFGDLRGKKSGVGVGQLIDLRMHGGQDIGVRVTEAGYGGATAGIEVLFLMFVDNVNAAGARGDKWGMAQ
jgi:hypothetical protein